jgi:heme oxygenase
MLRERLKSSTRSHHERLEERLDIRQQLLSEPQYLRLVLGFLGFYRPLEARLVEFAPAFAQLHISLPARLKTTHLEGDLMHLGLTAEEIEAVPRCTSLPALTTFARAVGCLYVLEGSTLGAQIIVQHLRRALPHLEPDTMRFFAGYGAQTGSMWRSFVAALDGHPWSDEEMTDAVDGACDTFERLEHWLVR